MEENPFIIYRTEDGLTHIDVKLINDTVWLTQAQITELFQRDKSVISRHISNVFEEGELSPDSVVAKFATTASDGKTYQMEYYNLDVIISVGYRVKSLRGTQFRIWANSVLRDYLVKGFVMNDERLKNPTNMNYFDEMLERIREIRASEKLFYQKIKDIYIKSVDYEPQSEKAQIFFKTVQNKMLFAVTGMTAAELIKERSDPALHNMGLTTWDGAKRGNEVRKSDVVTAKNYLNEGEISDLNRLVTIFLDLAEDTARHRRVMHMKDWETRLDEILNLMDKSILTNSGRISHNIAEKIVHERYAVFDQIRRKQEGVIAEQEAAEELRQLEKQITATQKE